MAVPSFSRIEIRHDTLTDVFRAANHLQGLSSQLLHLHATIADKDLLRLAVHSAIRETSTKLRGN